MAATKFLVQYVCPVHGVVKRVDKGKSGTPLDFLASCDDSIVCDVGEDQEICLAELFRVYD
jgi:hypothetical protein